MKKCLASLLFLMFPLLAGAQVTYNTVTATVVDPNGNPYANAQVTATLVTAANVPISGPVYQNGTLLTGIPVAGTLSATGVMSLQLVPTNTLTCVSACTPYWQIAISSPSDPAILTYQRPWNIAYTTTVTGTVDFSAQLSALAQPISFFNLKTGQNTGFPNVKPESYGAVGNGHSFFDGTVTGGTVLNATGTSVTPSAPSVTTTAANEVVVNLYDLNATWSAVPTTGTNRVNLAFSAGKYGLLANDQTVGSPGSVPAVTGTLSSSTAWLAGSIGLVPTTGNTISFVNVSTTQQAAGPTTFSVTAPTGIQSGDRIIACAAFYNLNTSITAPPAGFSTLFTTGLSNNALACYTRVVSSREPASYTWTQYGNFAGLAAFVAAYRNVANVDGGIVSSATAGFTASQVGYPICVGTNDTNINNLSSPPSYQTCGSITSFISSTQVGTSIPSSASTGMMITLGHDDTSAFQSMLTTAPCSTVGCNVSLSQKQYTLTGALTLTPNIPTYIVGQGAAVPNTINGWLNGDTPINSNAGTRLNVLTQNLTTPFINITGPSTSLSSYVATAALKGFAIVAGAGSNRDGGGQNGINVTNWQSMIADDVMVENFAGIGIYVDGLSSGNEAYSEQVDLRHVLLEWNNLNGLQVGSTTSGAGFVESTRCDSCILENNGAAGVALLGSGIEGFTLSNSVVQWNNLYPAQPEMVIGSAVKGCVVTGNYFEFDSNGGSRSTGPWTTTDHGCNFASNFIYPATNLTGTFAYADVNGYQHGGGFAGYGTATFAAGAAAGTSPGTPACATSHVCDSYSGTVNFTVGTSTTTGVMLTVTMPSGITRTNQANCSGSVALTASPYTALPLQMTATTTTFVFNVGTAPTASTAYQLTYNCGGN